MTKVSFTNRCIIERRVTVAPRPLVVSPARIVGTLHVR